VLAAHAAETGPADLRHAASKILTEEGAAMRRCRAEWDGRRRNAYPRGNGQAERGAVSRDEVPRRQLPMRDAGQDGRRTGARLDVSPRRRTRPEV